MSEQLKRAAELLRREAQILRDSSNDQGDLIYCAGRLASGEWSRNEDVKRDRDELLGAAEIVDKAIERLAEQQARIAELEALGRANDDEIELKQLCIAGMEEQADKMRSRIATLEAQAAIGRRAVAMLSKHRRYLGESVGEVAAEWCIECDSSSACADDCELAAILRDAEQAGVGV